MDIVFGVSADAGSFPDHGGPGEGTLGAPVVGPNGLLDVLNTARGLGMTATASVVRIAAFQAALEDMSGQRRFWSRSLEVDGWATPFPTTGTLSARNPAAEAENRHD